MPHPTRLRLTNREKYALARFGCFLRAAERVFYIDWSWPDLSIAKSASLVARLVAASEEVPSLLIVAFEVSPIPFLPRYTFCALDLTSRTHRDTLESILNSGGMPIRFVQQNKCVPRVLPLSKAEVDRCRELYNRALNRIGNQKADRAAFNAALHEFEWSERAPHCFPWFLSESEIELPTDYLKGQMSNLPAEQVQKWELLANRICAPLREMYGSRIEKWVGDIPAALFALHFVHDLDQALGHDPVRLVEFITAVYLPSVAHANAEEYGWVPEAAESFCGLVSKLEDSPPDKKAELLTSIARAGAEFWRRLSGNGRVSFKGFIESLGPVKPLLAGKPGRPTADYSVAHKLKRKEGLSWSQTAEKLYDATLQLQVEFRKPTFADLTFEEKHRVIDKLRHGVLRLEKNAPPGQNSQRLHP